MAAKQAAAGGKKPTNTKTQKSKSAPAKAPAKAEENEKLRQAKRQRSAILLLAASVLSVFLAVFKGQFIWNYLHEAMFGLFGICAWAVPVILAALAVVFVINRPLGGMKSEFVFAALVFVILSGIVHVSAHDAAYLSGNAFSIQFSDAWNYESIVHSGGVLGVLVGNSLAYLCGRVPAILFMVLVLIVALMLFSGTTLLAVYRALTKPVKKVGNLADARIEQSMRRREERLQAAQAERERETAEAEKVKRFDPDFAMGPEAVEPVAYEKNPAFMPDAGQSEKKKGKKSGSVMHPPVIPDLDEEFVPLPEEPPMPDVSVPAAEDIQPPKRTRRKKEEPLPQTENAVKEEKAEELPTEPFGVPDPVGEPEQRAYRKPPLTCLAQPVYNSEYGSSDMEIEQNSALLIKTLESFNVKATITGVFRGPSVTRYELLPAEGVKISKITSLADDIALRLAASGVRIEAPIPNKAAIGIEVPNRAKVSVTLREIIDTDVYRRGRAKSILNVALGKDIAGNVICVDLAKMPHLLIAGTTGSGKSVCVNSMITSILFNATPDEVRLLMIDPKQVEFTVYSGIPHLLVPVVSDPRKASGALNWAVTEMLGRYKRFSEKNVRNITGYNKLAETDPEIEPMNRIVIFIDELSDLMMVAQSEVEDAICRLAQMARAAGMHLVIATQRPSVDVITGLIKANIPSRIALSVSSSVDSRTILDAAGAEKLLGYGDMLYNPVGMSKPLRVQGCFVSDGEVEDIVNYIKNQEESSYDEAIMDEIERQATVKKKGAEMPAEDGGEAQSNVDEKLQKAIEVVVEAQMASTTLLQRKLSLGYARAARLIDELEERKIVGPFEGSKPRKVLITKQQWMEMCALSSDPGAENIEPPEDNEPPFDIYEEPDEGEAF